jgi:uncharacterized membrane protein YidH (DUF202 family)
MQIEDKERKKNDIWVFMISITIILTFYIFFSAAKCRFELIHHKYNERDDLHKTVTSFLSKTTILLALFWWISLILNSFMKSTNSLFEPNPFIRETLLIIICIICILSLLIFRNTTYRKYLDDNIVRVIYIEYSLSFISGILYAFLLTYTIETVLYIF